MAWQDNAIGYFMGGSTLGLAVYEIYGGWQSAGMLIAQSGATEILDTISTYTHEMGIKGAGGFVVGFAGSAAIVACSDFIGRKLNSKRKVGTRQSPSPLEQTAGEQDET